MEILYVLVFVVTQHTTNVPVEDGGLKIEMLARVTHEVKYDTLQGCNQAKQLYEESIINDPQYSGVPVNILQSECIKR